MVYGTQGILENANYYGTISDDYNVLAECYEGVLMFEQNMSDIMTAVGAAEFTYLKETGELKAYNEADKQALGKAIQGAIETLKAKISDAIDKVVIWFNQTVISGIMVKASEKIDKSKISNDAHVLAIAYYELSELEGFVTDIKDMTSAISSGYIRTYADFMTELKGSGIVDLDSAEAELKVRKEAKQTNILVRAQIDKSLAALKSKKHLTILKDVKTAIKSIKITKDMDESTVTDLKKIISALGRIYSKLVFQVKESILVDVKVVRAGMGDLKASEKAAKDAQKPKKPDKNPAPERATIKGQQSDDWDKPAAKNESSFLDGFLDSIY